MPTVSPSYSLKGVSNPYYTMDPFMERFDEYEDWNQDESTKKSK